MVAMDERTTRAAVKYGKPFPHTVVEGYMSPDEVLSVLAEFWQARDRMKVKAGATSVKWSCEEVGAFTQSIIDSVDITMIERLTGISGLFLDPDNFGGGYHCIPPGGFLDMHVDFNVHPAGYHRRVNVLIYLNPGWRPEWGGQLVLGKDREVSIEPYAGRAVIFETNEESWHGHPARLRCPPGEFRRSLAIYLYTNTWPEREAHTTIYEK